MSNSSGDIHVTLGFGTTLLKTVAIISTSQMKLPSNHDQLLLAPSGKRSLEHFKGWTLEQLLIVGPSQSRTYSTRTPYADQLHLVQ